jgi:hypothetical protein
VWIHRCCQLLMLVLFSLCGGSEHLEVKHMILRHLRQLRSNEIYRKAHFLIFIEANMSYISADCVANWCRRPEFGPVTIEARDNSPRGRVGVWTGPWEKESYSMMLREIIESGRLFMAHEFICSNFEEHLKTLLLQFSAFRMERQEPMDAAFGKYRWAFTGKTSGGTKDDMVLALMIAVYWGRLKREDFTFMQWAHSMGIRLQ